MRSNLQRTWPTDFFIRDACFQHNNFPLGFLFHRIVHDVVLSISVGKSFGKRRELFAFGVFCLPSRICHSGI